jgi:hypothetical protein
MKKFVAAAVVGFGLSAAAASAGVVTHTFDISGLASDLAFGGAFPTLTHDFGVPGTVVGVAWDVNYESFSPSWISEAQIAIDSNDDLSLDGDIDPSAYGAGDVPGLFAYSGSIPANTVSSDGLVFLTLWESFTDGVTPDALYGSNSTVTVSFLVPAPGAAALLGLGGLVAIRRRR